eukprot:SAG31_NODE_74_length_27628_cov_18.235642_8_plen_47_part_00
MLTADDPESIKSRDRPLVHDYSPHSSFVQCYLCWVDRASLSSSAVR